MRLLNTIQKVNSTIKARGTGTIIRRPLQADLYRKSAERYMQKKLAPYTNTSMKNTSFFSWSGVKILESQCQHIVDLWAELYENTLNQTSIQSQSVSRISEQVVLSLVPRLFGLPFSFLKDSDKQFDGSICESSYYGASGGRFALWGNTNRKPWF